MGRDKDVERFQRDFRDFAKSAAGHVPGLGKAIGIHETYQKGSKLAKSTPKALNALKCRARSSINRRVRRLARYRW